MKKILIIIVASILTSCAKTATTNTEIVVQDKTSQITPKGVVQYTWEPPMVDVIEVPPGLDPEGHYYRPSHEEVVEIRQGRWKYYPQADNK